MTMRGILQRVIKSKRVFRSAIFEHNKGAIQSLIYTKSVQISEPVPSHKIFFKNKFVVKP